MSSTRNNMTVYKGKKIGMGEAYLGDNRVAVTQISLTQGEAVAVGTVMDIQSTSKGKGFAGVVKRWNFSGGPKTHGQSDRERAPGSIGQGTTPGRVRAGKKMAGRMGSDTVTMKQSVVVAVKQNIIWVTGPVAGVKGATVRLTAKGTKKIADLKYLTGGIPSIVEVGSSNPVESSTEEVKDTHEN